MLKPAPRRIANADEHKSAAFAAALAARANAEQGAHYARIANSATDAVMGSIDPSKVIPASLVDIANAAHRAAKGAAIAEGATPETIGDAVLVAALAANVKEIP